MRTLTAAAIAIVGLWSPAGAGCGTTCEEIRADRDAFFARHETTQVPHAELVLPLDLANKLVAARLGRRESARLDLPMLRNSGVTVAFELRGVRLIPSEPGYVGVVVDMGVVDQGQGIVSLSVEARVRPTFDAVAHKAVVWLRPSDLRGIAPHLEEGGLAHVRSWIRGALPEALARAAPDRVLDELAAVVSDWFAFHGFPLIRDNLLDGLDDVPLVELAIPDLPLRDVRFTSVAGRQPALVLELLTALPVAHGLAPRSGLVRPGVIELRVAGDAAAAIANEAMARGLLPARYTEGGKPAPDGPFEARVGWEPGRRPLKVHLWRGDGRCLYARVGGTPVPRLDGEEAGLAVEDGEYEVVRGPALTEAFAWTKRLWGDSVALNIAVAKKTRVDIGGVPLILAVSTVEIGREALRVELRAELGVGNAALGMR